ncbi:hypothetical protein PHYPSEUDO_002253 [Phytophthora pseudosyringae]|uniref:Uncharacterized protein n=1 Tax=Phytophthora pseudosyringae TaxID=221518 RepID=A0A8T1VYQ2_9STRA|nr:hypothetical protein PHYPSEUDO_002253 [Phytophthora pseudosyringae]
MGLNRLATKKVNLVTGFLKNPLLAARSSADHTSAAGKTRERERWKHVINNWRALEGDDLIELTKDNSVLKKIRGDGWEKDPARYPDNEAFYGLYAGEYGPTQAVLARAKSSFDLFLSFLPPDFWLEVER